MEILLAMAPPAGGGDASGNLVSTLIMFAAIFGIFYFMIIRPQQKRAKEREKLLSEIQKGDKVVTSGGIHGTVASIEEKTVLLQIADNVKIKIDRSAINYVVK
ncbi:MAG TPA: preprotein translocase subunit YajC [Ignavibacteriales bacterium]|nr:preprotein translocase subunit YajC [Ignavibacteriales bacterium]